MAGLPTQKERELQAALKEKERELKQAQADVEDKDDLLAKAKVSRTESQTLLFWTSSGRWTLSGRIDQERLIGSDALLKNADVP